MALVPWDVLLETRHGIGGCSFIQFGDLAAGNELSVDVHLGARRLTSPAARLDAIIVVDFVAHALADVTRL